MLWPVIDFIWQLCVLALVLILLAWIVGAFAEAWEE
jgi:hypothetical protein